MVVSNSTLVSPEEAQRLIARGYTYVDVRSESEFLIGHAPGAFNVPLQRVEGDRLVDNSAFVTLMQQLFRTTDPLLIGCRSGSRSHVAVERLERAGFEALAELRHGFLGTRDGFGRRVPGWVQAGLAVEAGDGGERSYERLLDRARSRERG
ncbi:MAG TPA: rhodanese-like domain-containing protein [Polyangiaceae bacterium]|nr:rhodanese-like domain-containing protein [Polyangiaceae bacterium]